MKERQAFLKSLNKQELETLLDDWVLWARKEQLPPEGVWQTWLFMGGRGAGKTRAGAEWVKGCALGRMPFTSEPVERIALVGESLNDVRETMIEGVSGLLSVHKRSERPIYEPSRRRITWANGAIAQIFSAEDPDSLRGPQFGAAWCDELAKWVYATETYTMLQFGLRLGTHPRQMITTTPRRHPLLKEILNAPNTVLTHATTMQNRANLSSAFMKTVLEKYQGTHLGRQEINGEYLEDSENGLWQREVIEKNRLSKQTAPSIYEKIVIAVDPPVTAKTTSAACGICVLGKVQKKFYLLEDVSLNAARPELWASEAIRAYRRYEADALVVEVNQGGDLVKTVIHAIAPEIPITEVRATRGKIIRAEPIALLYAQGRVHHVGIFEALEDELCTFDQNGKSNGKSPDRLDALVWGITHLSEGAHRPTIKRL